MKGHEPATIEEIVWIPGQGPDAALLHHLAGVFPKPNVPLGEAWFMGETRFLYDDLNAYGIEGTPDKHLGGYFDELISGLACFPEMAVWSQWYGYLTPRILSSPRFQEEDWHSMLCTGLITWGLSPSEGPLATWEADFARVLSPWIMSKQFWNEGHFLPLRVERLWLDSWGYGGINATVSRSLLFTLRYLHLRGIPNWLKSVLAIEDVLWRAHFLAWLLQIWPILEQRTFNYSFFKNDNRRDLLSGFVDPLRYLGYQPEKQQWNLISPENMALFQTAIEQEFDQDRYFEWIDQFSEHPELKSRMDVLLEQLQTKFL